MRFGPAALLLTAAFAAAQNPPAKEESDPIEEIANEYRDRYGSLEHPAAQAYLERVAAEAAGALEGKGPCCSIHLLRDYSGAPPWPQAAPGGLVFVPITSLLQAPDERSFAGRMAHAVAHARQDAAAPQAGRDAESPGVIHGIWCGQPEAVPANMRPQYEERERRADEAAEAAVKAVKLGSGEFEKLRHELSKPQPPTPLP